jgi:protein-tyrosine phosphatase
MIDIHCHILPGLDDGPATLEESVEMCRIAYADGIRTIVATPHYRPGSYEYPSHVVQSKIDELRSSLSEGGINIQIYLGADVTVTPELEKHLQIKPYLTINATGRYFLAEFPHAAVPPNWEKFLFTLIRQGIVPIITHPERNGWFLSHPDALVSFVRAGGLVQITALSVTGEGGIESRRYTSHLLKNGLAHIIATDAHSVNARKPLLSSAVELAESLVGRERVAAMVNDIPKAVIEGRKVIVEDLEVSVQKRRSWFRRIARI